MAYFHQKKPGIEETNRNLKTIVVNYDFWERLSFALKIFIFIDQYQRASEIEDYKLHTVAAVWNKICFYLYVLCLYRSLLDH